MVAEVIGGAALIAGGVIVGSPLMIEMGVSLEIAGISGLLAGTPPGKGVSVRNPVAPWQIAYGNIKVPGTMIFMESNGGIQSGGNLNNDKCFQAVYLLTGHRIKAISEVRMNGKAIPLGAGGSGALSTEWTYTPPSNQNKTNITSISRSGGVVTMKLASGIADQIGKRLSVQSVHDHTFNGQWQVLQPNPTDASTFTYQCGGPDTTSTGGFVLTCEPDYKNRIHVDRTSCLGTHTGTFPELLSNTALWTSAHRNLDKASCYIGYYYDPNVFTSGIPQTSFVVEGYDYIYDPRLGDYSNPAAHIWTDNAALIIADYLYNPIWGFGLSYGTDIPLAQLSSAANICDEAIPLAAGGTEKRYTINMTFDLNRGRGEVLQDMLSACAGRISIQSGQFIIAPGAWVGPSLSLSAANLIGPLELKPVLSMMNAANAVKGTYCSAGLDWNSGDIPPYMEDALHGHASDRWLAADNGVRLYKDVAFPATTSCPTAQRLAKIDLERLRNECRLTLHCDMSAYTAVALDIVEFSYPRYGWVNKTFEVLSSKLVVNKGANGEAPVLGFDLDLAEVSSDIYDWSSSEELTPADTVSPALDNGQTVLGPQTLVIESGPSTTYVGADGIALPRILAGWEVSPDVAVQQGGYIVVEYQKVGDTYWTPAGTVGGAQTQCYISGVVSGQNYSVQVQAFTAKGVSSSWAQAGPITVSATATFMAASDISYPDGTPVSLLQPAEAGSDATANQPLAHTGSSANLIANGNFLLGNIKGWTTDGGAAFNAGGIGFAYNQSSISPTFNVVPGQNYRFSFTGNTSSGAQQTTYHRLYYAGTYSPNTGHGATAGCTYFDLLAGGAIPGAYQTVNYPPWTCPAGVYYASLAIFNLSPSVYLSYNNVSAQDYGAAAQWGADVTLSNTAAGIVNQGSLATINQANTSNIVAHAVNSQITFQNTSFTTVAPYQTATVAQSTITTQGGYVKIRLMMEVAQTSPASTPGGVGVTLRQGGASGNPLTGRGSIYLPAYTSGQACFANVAMEYVDTNFSLAQQYTVTVDASAVNVSCGNITFVVENAKV